MFKFNFSLLVVLTMFTSFAYSESGKFVFECQKINESTKQASLLINFDLKKIEFDSFEKRKKWEEFNDFMSRRNLPNYSYVLDEYSITDVTSNELTGNKKYLLHQEKLKLIEIPL